MPSPRPVGSPRWKAAYVSFNGFGPLVAVVVIAVQAVGARAAAHPSSCLPTWRQQGQECPFGRELAFDVSWNYEVHDTDPFWHLLAVMWSFVPVCVITLAVLEFFLRRGTRELQFLLFTATITLFNDSILKPLLAEPRPEGSCACTCGMPSGHATVSIGMLTLMLLDGMHRIVPIQDDQVALSGLRRLCARPTTIPLTTLRVLSHAQFVMLSSVWVLLLLPVPWARVVLKDHSNSQVLAGGGLGALEAAIWFFIARSLEQRIRPDVADWKYQPDWSRVHLLVHNYYMPTLAELRQEILRVASASEMLELSTQVSKAAQPRGVSSGQGAEGTSRASEASPSNWTSVVQPQL